MKRYAFIFAIVAICSLSSSFAQDEKDTTVEKFLKDWAGSLQKGDSDKMAGLYEDSNDVIAIQSTGRIRKGIGEIRKEYESAFSEVVFEKAELQNLTLHHNGEIAWATCRFKADTKVKLDNSAWTLEIFTSFVLKRTGGKWHIVLEQSTPIGGIPRVRSRQQPMTGEGNVQ